MQKKKVLAQLIQFSMVGGFNGIIDIAVLNVLLILWPTNDNNQLLLFNTIAYLFAIMNSYIWNTRFAFKGMAKKTKREKIMFLVQAAISLIISNVVFILSYQLFDLTPISNWVIQNLSKGLSMFFSSAASFFSMKYLVFRPIKNVRS